ILCYLNNQSDSLPYCIFILDYATAIAWLIYEKMASSYQSNRQIKNWQNVGSITMSITKLPIKMTLLITMKRILIKVI
ncbi:MAG: hypothetical protein V3R68_04735, partial [Gammaproteobacteria bacterium]